MKKIKEFYNKYSKYILIIGCIVFSAVLSLILLLVQDHTLFKQNKDVIEPIMPPSYYGLEAEQYAPVPFYEEAEIEAPWYTIGDKFDDYEYKDLTEDTCGYIFSNEEYKITIWNEYSLAWENVYQGEESIFDDEYDHKNIYTLTINDVDWGIIEINSHGKYKCEIVSPSTRTYITVYHASDRTILPSKEVIKDILNKCTKNSNNTIIRDVWIPTEEDYERAAEFLIEIVDGVPVTEEATDME